MSKRFRDWNPCEQYLFPPSPMDWLPEDHLVYFLLDVVGQFDLQPIFDHYLKSDRGQPAFHPRMMVTLLLYAYCSGTFSSRRIMRRSETDAAYRVIVGEDVPNFRTISDFRKLHLEALQGLFMEVLILCKQAGLARVGTVSLDGSKGKANASRH